MVEKPALLNLLPYSFFVKQNYMTFPDKLPDWYSIIWIINFNNLETSWIVYYHFCLSHQKSFLSRAINVQFIHLLPTTQPVRGIFFFKSLNLWPERKIICKRKYMSAPQGTILGPYWQEQKSNGFYCVKLIVCLQHTNPQLLSCYWNTYNMFNYTGVHYLFIGGGEGIQQAICFLTQPGCRIKKVNYIAPGQLPT